MAVCDDAPGKLQIDARFLATSSVSVFLFCGGGGGGGVPRFPMTCSLWAYTKNQYSFTPASWDQEKIMV